MVSNTPTIICHGVSFVYCAPAHMVSHPYDCIFVTGAKLGLHLCPSVLKNWRRGGEGRERDREDEKNSRSSCSRVPLVLYACEHDERGLLLDLLKRIPFCRARARLSFSPCADTTDRVFFSSYWEQFPFVVIVCAPVLSTREHDEQGIILILLRTIPVRRARAYLLFSPHANTTNRVFFSSSWE